MPTTEDVLQGPGFQDEREFWVSGVYLWMYVYGEVAITEGQKVGREGLGRLRGQREGLRRRAFSYPTCNSNWQFTITSCTMRLSYRKKALIRIMKMACLSVHVSVEVMCIYILIL